MRSNRSNNRGTWNELLGRLSCFCVAVTLPLHCPHLPAPAPGSARRPVRQWPHAVAGVALRGFISSVTRSRSTPVCSSRPLTHSLVDPLAVLSGRNRRKSSVQHAASCFSPLKNTWYPQVSGTGRPPRCDFESMDGLVFGLTFECVLFCCLVIPFFFLRVLVPFGGSWAAQVSSAIHGPIMYASCMYAFWFGCVFYKRRSFAGGGSVV